MTNSLFDSHAHIYLCPENPDTIITNAIQAGVTGILNVGISIDTSITAAKLAMKYPRHVAASLGIHPSDITPDETVSDLEDVLGRYPFVAIGEIGLDYYHMTQPPDVQQKWFRDQIAVANAHHLPVIIHTRNAEADMAAVLSTLPDFPRVFHCYSSDIAFAKEVNSPNTFFSFTGTITYSKKGKVIDTIRWLPIEKILIETDCPYLTPAAYKGQKNQPAYVGEVAVKIAQIKEMDVDTVIARTTANAKQLFALPNHSPDREIVL